MVLLLNIKKRSVGIVNIRLVIRVAPALTGCHMVIN